MTLEWAGIREVDPTPSSFPETSFVQKGLRLETGFVKQVQDLLYSSLSRGTTSLHGLDICNDNR